MEKGKARPLSVYLDNGEHIVRVSQEYAQSDPDKNFDFSSAPDPAEATLALEVELALKEAPTIAKVPFPLDLVRVVCDCGVGLIYYNEHCDCRVYPQYLHRGEEEEVDKILREDHRLLRCRSCYRLVMV